MTDPTFKDRAGLEAKIRAQLDRHIGRGPAAQLPIKLTRAEWREVLGANPLAMAKAGLDAAAAIAAREAKQWRNFAMMGLPAMPGPSVCKVFAEKAETIRDAILAIDPATLEVNHATD